MILSRIVTSSLALASSFCLVTNAKAQPAVAPAPAKPIGFVIPQWKSADNQIIIRGRARFVHDFYNVSRDFDGGTINGETSNDDLRALRIGIDGQLSPKIKIRADANLTASQINWADVYIGYTTDKYEVYVGQSYLTATLENATPDINFPLPENSLVTTAFGQSVRGFGVVGRIKRANWQAVGGVYSGNINAGDIFGDDVLRYAQARGTYAFRKKDRDAFHLGASIRVRDAQAGPLLRYSTRPAATNYGPRTLDSGAVAKSDTTLSLEGLIIRGSLMVTGEHEMAWADTARGTVAINGTYLEGCYWFTGESRRYLVGTGTVGQVKPKKSIFEGGLGAIALVGRIERLDQSDARLGTRAGRVEAATIGVSWTPIEYVLFRLAASHSQYSGPNSARNGTADVVMGRAQFAF